MQLAGAVLLAVGVWVQVDSSSLLGFLETVEGSPVDLSQLANVGILVISVGAVLAIIGFLGCCGAIKESRCMLLTFFIIVLLIFLVEVAGVVLLFVFQDVANELFSDLENGVQANIKNEYGENEKLTSLWDTTMLQLQCCGYRNYTDFDGSPFNSNVTLGNIYPDMCCNTTIPTGTCNEDKAHYSNIIGCFDKLVQLIEENAVIVAGVVLAIAVLEVAAMVVSMILYKDIGRKA
ncbi:hypothetical protein LDENG_00032540 [Lucifuga dentata]|nr:hypothetical protein LDENG_00032540 [Lucifuga dentata]